MAGRNAAPGANLPGARDHPMWYKITNMLTDWDPRHFFYFMIGGLALGFFLLRGWMSKNKY